MEPICRIKELYKTLYQFEKLFAERYAVTINEAMLLCCLRDGESRTAGALCDYVGLSGSRVSKIITSVENKGLIRRGIGLQDRRQMLFSLTEAGAAKLWQMHDAAAELEALFARLKSALAAGQSAPASEQSAPAAGQSAETNR